MIRPPYKENLYWKADHILILLILACLCYWPLTFGIFSAKNDNIQQFLPIRFHVSEALRNGHLPLWSPYIYTGYPIHGDTQGGAWNPVVWILSVFGRYNVTSLHFEIIICIFIAGCGMYRLLGTRNISASLKLAGAAAYMMSGFVTDVAGSNLPFLWASAYVPFVFAYDYELLRKPSLRTSIKTAIALGLLFCSAYPSFFIITCYVMAAAFLVVVIKAYINKNRPAIKPILVYAGLMVVFFTGLACAVILSYLHVLPFYDRGSGVQLAQVFVNSFHPSCTVSMVLPSLPFKNPDSFSTDLISRNAYFNIVLLICLFSYAWMRKTLFLNFIFAGILFFYLFSMGDFTPVRKLCYNLLPLMDTFRHPSNARLFLVIGGIVTGILMLELMARQAVQNYARIISIIISVALLAWMIAGLPGVKIISTTQQLFSGGGDMRAALKTFLDQLTLNDVLLINGMIQVATIGALLYLWRKKKFQINGLAALIIINSFVLAQLTIPYTLVSKVSPRPINSLLRSYPVNYPDPGNQSIRINSSDVLENYDMIGINGFYNKKITLTDVTFTPTFMRPIEKVLADSNLKSVVLNNPYAYFATHISGNNNSPAPNGIITDDTKLLNIHKPGKGRFELLKFTNNRFEFNTESGDTSVFCLQQLWLPGWHCEIDGKNTKLSLVNHAYMAVKLPEGRHHVKMYYKPTSIIIGLIISILSILAVLYLFLKPSRYNHA